MWEVTVHHWYNFVKDDPPLPDDDENKETRKVDICSWDADFLKIDQGTLFELILAANFLDIKASMNFIIQLKDRIGDFRKFRKRWLKITQTEKGTCIIHSSTSY